MAEEIELTPDPRFGVGTWSNWTRVLPGKEEITIDFAVRDPLEPGRGALIARISLPLGAAFNLRDALIEVMPKYTDPDQSSRG